MKQSIAVIPLALVCLTLDARAETPPPTAVRIADPSGMPAPAPTSAVSPSSAASQTDANQPRAAEARAAEAPAPSPPGIPSTETPSTETPRTGVTAPAQTKAVNASAPPSSATKPANASAPPSSATKPVEPPKPKKDKSPFEHCRKAKDGTEPAAKDCRGVFGLRASTTDSNVDGSNHDIGLMISVQGEEYRLNRLWSTRGTYRLSIGGGEAGFEGAMLGGWAGGVRLPVAPCGRHGPVLRLGMYGYILGNDAFYGSLIELPQLQVGYQYQHEQTLVELGATGGAVLTGRSRAAATERRILGSGFEYGAYAAVQLQWLRLGVSAMRLPTDDAWTKPVDVLEGTLCGFAGPLAICSDIRAAVTDTRVNSEAPLTEVRSVHAGLTLGVASE